MNRCETLGFSEIIQGFVSLIPYSELRFLILRAGCNYMDN